MSSRRSILVRLVIIQMLVLQVLWLVSSYLGYRNALTTETGSFDRQQAIVAKGMAAVAQDLASERPELVAQSIRRMEQTYRDAFEQSMISERGERIGFSPIFEVKLDDGKLLYRSANQPAFNLPPHDGAYVDHYYEGKDWHFYTVRSDTGRIEVTLGETLDVRRAIFRPPLKSILISLALQFVVFMLISWIALRLGLRPLRIMTRELANRPRLDLRPFEPGAEYRETQPLVRALNDLMRRVATLLQHEKAFLADAAHELRTPITAVRTQLHVLLNARNEAERTEVAHEIEAGLDRAASLTHQLITIARVESEAFAVQPVAVDLAEYAQDVIATLAPTALRRNLDLAYNGPTSLMGWADPAALQSILTNLIGNAIKYVPPGGHIDVQLSAHANGQRITVRDDGPGVPSDSLGRLFERFYRVPGVEASGSGLGLAIVKNLVEYHGGQIDIVEGLSGQGIGFAIHLPKQSTPQPL